MSYLQRVVRRTMQVLLAFDLAARGPVLDQAPPGLHAAVIRTHKMRRALYQPFATQFREHVRARGLSRALSALGAAVRRIRERDLH